MRALGSIWPSSAARRGSEEAGESGAIPTGPGRATLPVGPQASAHLLRGRSKPTRAQALGENAKVAAVLRVLGGLPVAGVGGSGAVEGRELALFLAGGREATVGSARQSSERRSHRAAVAFAIEEVLAGRLTVVAAASDLGVHTNSVTTAKNRFILGGRLALEREYGTGV